MSNIHLAVTVFFVVLAVAFDGTKNKFDFARKICFIGIATVLTVQLAQQHT